jgi:membrane protein required for colicin V production
LNYVDVILLAIIIFPALTGLNRGFLKTLFSLLGIVAGLVLATFFYVRLSQYFGFVSANPQYAKLASFLAILIATHFLFVFISRQISGINKFTKSTDKFLGFVFGFAKGFVMAGVLVMSLKFVSIIPKEKMDNSQVCKIVETYSSVIYKSIF